MGNIFHKKPQDEILVRIQEDVIEFTKAKSEPVRVCKSEYYDFFAQMCCAIRNAGKQNSVQVQRMNFILITLIEKWGYPDLDVMIASDNPVTVREGKILILKLEIKALEELGG